MAPSRCTSVMPSSSHKHESCTATVQNMSSRPSPTSADKPTDASDARREATLPVSLMTPGGRLEMAAGLLAPYTMAEGSVPTAAPTVGEGVARVRDPSFSCNVNTTSSASMVQCTPRFRVAGAARHGLVSSNGCYGRGTREIQLDKQSGSLGACFWFVLRVGARPRKPTATTEGDDWMTSQNNFSAGQNSLGKQRTGAEYCRPLGHRNRRVLASGFRRRLNPDDAPAVVQHVKDRIEQDAQRVLTAVPEYSVHCRCRRR